MRRSLLWLAALAVLAPLNGCAPDANAETPKALSVSVVMHAGSAWVVGSWKNGTVTDGKGALTNVLTYLVNGTDSTGHTLSPTATKDSFPLTTAVGVTQSGKFCVVAKRRALAAPASCANWSHTEADTPPPGSTMDSAFVRQAMLNSVLLDTALVAIVSTGEECPAELRDYHHGMLIVPHGTQTPNCQAVFDGELTEQNLKTLASIAAGYPWTTTQDSIWRSLMPRPEAPDLPNTFISTHWFPGPMTGDTTVFGPGENNVPIATYRVNHPDFTWPPAGT